MKSFLLFEYLFLNIVETNFTDEIYYGFFKEQTK